MTRLFLFLFLSGFLAWHTCRAIMMIRPSSWIASCSIFSWISLSIFGPPNNIAKRLHKQLVCIQIRDNEAKPHIPSVWSRNVLQICDTRT